MYGFIIVLIVSVFNCSLTPKNDSGTYLLYEKYLKINSIDAETGLEFNWLSHYHCIEDLSLYTIDYVDFFRDSLLVKFDSIISIDTVFRAHGTVEIKDFRTSIKGGLMKGDEYFDDYCRDIWLSETGLFHFIVKPCFGTRTEIEFNPRIIRDGVYHLEDSTDLVHYGIQANNVQELYDASDSITWFLIEITPKMFPKSKHFKRGNYWTKVSPENFDETGRVAEESFKKYTQNPDINLKHVRPYTLHNDYGIFSVFDNIYVHAGETKEELSFISFPIEISRGTKLYEKVSFKEVIY